MSGFATWLRHQSNSDPGIAALRTFADAARWPYWSDSRPDYEAAINTAAPPNSADLLIALGQQFERWTISQGNQGETPETWSDVIARFALIGFGVLVALMLGFGLYNSAFYSSLASVDQTRGLITFLVTIAATATIILIGVGIFWLEDKEEVKERFAAAKDLLTVVIGVLGTILGFYFGTRTTEAQKPNPPPSISQTAGADERTQTSQGQQSNQAATNAKPVNKHEEQSSEAQQTNQSPKPGETKE